MHKHHQHIPIISSESLSSSNSHQLPLAGAPWHALAGALAGALSGAPWCQAIANHDGSQASIRVMRTLRIARTLRGVRLFRVLRHFSAPRRGMHRLLVAGCWGGPCGEGHQSEGHQRLTNQRICKEGSLLVNTLISNSRRTIVMSTCRGVEGIAGVHWQHHVVTDLDAGAAADAVLCLCRLDPIRASNPLGYVGQVFHSSQRNWGCAALTHANHTHA